MALKPKRGVVDPRSGEIHPLPALKDWLYHPKVQDGTWEIEYLPDSKDKLAMIFMDNGEVAYVYRDDERISPERKPKGSRENDVSRGLESPQKNTPMRGPVVPEGKEGDIWRRRAQKGTDKKLKEVRAKLKDELDHKYNLVALGVEDTSKVDENIKQLSKKLKSLTSATITNLGPRSTKEEIQKPLKDLAALQSLTSEEDDFVQESVEKIKMKKMNQPIGDDDDPQRHHVDPYDMSKEGLTDDEIADTYGPLPEEMDPFRLKRKKKKLDARGINDRGL